MGQGLTAAQLFPVRGRECCWMRDPKQPCSEPAHEPGTSTTCEHRVQLQPRTPQPHTAAAAASPDGTNTGPAALTWQAMAISRELHQRWVG